MSNKELVMETLRRLPEDATLEEISEQIAILAAIRRGEAAAVAGRLISHEEVKHRTGMAAPIPTKEEVAFRLAQSHYVVEPGITQIYRLVKEDHEEEQTDEPVKLLEVSEDSLPVGIRPVYFRPHPPSGIVYSTAIVEVTPAEFDRLGRDNGGLQLPIGWRLAYSVERAPTPPSSARR
jgi:hypothetical protein